MTPKLQNQTLAANLRAIFEVLEAGTSDGGAVACFHFILSGVRRYPEWAMAWEELLSREVPSGVVTDALFARLVNEVGSPIEAESEEE